jgi:thioredoxin reductase
MESETFDVVVVGGGAAGLSAALVLGRARRRIAIVDAGEPRNAPAAHMYGFLSRDGMSPADLLAAGRAEVKSYGVELFHDRVVAIDAGFHVRLAGGPRLKARRILIATGAHDEFPDISGAHERWGRDFLHCPYCHGWEVRDQAIGVVGTHQASVDHAHLLRQWSDDVIFFTHTYSVTAAERATLEARNIDIVDGLVERLSVVDDHLAAVQLTDGTSIPRDAVFVRPTIKAHEDGLLDSLGCAFDETGFVSVDDTGRTSVPAVWVAGNAANPRAQVITAAGEGSAAAIAINADLVEEDIRDALGAVTEPHPTTSLKGAPMNSTIEHPPTRTPPPTKHQLAFMIWLCVFPTLTASNLAFGDWLRTLSPVLRTFVLATVAVPIVIYVLMPYLHRLRVRLMTATGARRSASVASGVTAKSPHSG